MWHFLFALFLCYTSLMLHYFHIALCLCCNLSMLHVFHVALIPCCVFFTVLLFFRVEFMLPSFHIALFCVALFLCGTFAELQFSCCTLVLQFCVALFSCCIFCAALFHFCILLPFQFLHVELFLGFFILT